MSNSELNPPPIHLQLRLRCFRSVLTSISLLALLTGCQSDLAKQANARVDIRVNEPAFIGKVVGFDTKAPLEGVIVYGFYATTQGSLGGGSSIGEHIRSFETQTDANGEFRLPAWNSGERRYSDAPFGGKMPRLAFYKPGYVVDTSHLQTIAKFRPLSYTDADFLVDSKPVIEADGTVDWRGKPHNLKPVTTELERYNALVDSRDSMFLVGPCGWETYTKLLFAQHIEWKSILRKNLPPEKIDAAGYGVSGFVSDIRWLNGITERTAVDRMIARFESMQNDWNCSDPKVIFGAKK